jgi:hypothetical protein
MRRDLHKNILSESKWKEREEEFFERKLLRTGRIYCKSFNKEGQKIYKNIKDVEYMLDS